VIAQQAAHLAFTMQVNTVYHHSQTPYILSLIVLDLCCRRATKKLSICRQNYQTHLILLILVFYPPLSTIHSLTRTLSHTPACTCTHIPNLLASTFFSPSLPCSSLHPFLPSPARSFPHPHSHLTLPSPSPHPSLTSPFPHPHLTLSFSSFYLPSHHLSLTGHLLRDLSLVVEADTADRSAASQVALLLPVCECAVQLREFIRLHSRCVRV
jgi:hypothetical protein